jgi:hypothetical protein
VRALLAAALLAAALRRHGAHAQCSAELALPAEGGGGDDTGAVSTGASGWCPAYAQSAFASAPVLCAPPALLVPPGGVLAFGTCALPGAMCSGATALALRSAATGATLAAVDRVLLNSSVAALAQGCVLGARCSYGAPPASETRAHAGARATRRDARRGAQARRCGQCQPGNAAVAAPRAFSHARARARVLPPSKRARAGEWQNPALSPAAVTVAESCYGDSACAGVVAWRVRATAALQSAAPAPAAPTALAFRLLPARAATLTGLRGTATPGATVRIHGWAGDAFNASGAALADEGRWRLLWTGVWGSAATQAITLHTPLSLTAGANASLHVSVSVSPGVNLTCAHSLGDVASTLLSDDVLTVMQAGALPGAAFTAGNAGAWPWPARTCAWSGLSLTYEQSGAACSPPAPAPFPDIVTSVPNTLVGSLDDLLRALAEPNVTGIEVNAHIALNGSELTAARHATTGKRTVQILGTNACRTADPSTPLCSLDAGGLSRILNVTDGVTLRVGHLALVNGAAPAGASGGCIIAACATCALTLDAAEFVNCSASASGGGVALYGGGTLAAQRSTFAGNVAAHGGGMLVHDGTAVVAECRFISNVARSAAADAPILPADLLGPSGGGLALESTLASVRGCEFEDNAAATSDFVLVANPELPQARGGGLFVSDSNVSVSATTFARNAAFYGGGAYLHASAVDVSGCALLDNTATLGDGGALFAGDCPSVFVNASLVARNTAGGHTGGGFAAIATDLDVDSTVFAGNAAPSGCGGAVGADVGASLTIELGSMLSNNSARSGGALCCDWCAFFWIEDSFMYDNQALAGSGGALWLRSSPGEARNVSMRGNAAPAGGAVSAVSSTLSLTDCALTGNAALATHGGAVLHTAYDDRLEDLTLTRCVVSNNTCLGGGAGVAAFSSRAVTLDSCTLDHNTIDSAAPAGGGVLALDVPTLLLSNCTLSYNKVRLAPALEDDARLGFVDSVNALGVGLGGGLWVGSNEVTSATVTGSTFTRNSGPSAGAIYATGRVRLSVRATDFYHDHSTDWGGRGGGIVTDRHAALDMADSLMFSCEANAGGGSWHGGQSTALYTRVLFEENEGVPGEDMKGTTLQVTDSAQLTVTASVFYNNIGIELAEGTIALAGTNESQLTISHTLFDKNFAFLGGCLFIVRCARAVRVCTFVRRLRTSCVLTQPPTTRPRLSPCTRRRCHRRSCSCT